MTELLKLRKLGQNSAGDNGGISLPKDTLRLEGLIGEEGELVRQPYLRVEYEGDGEWHVFRIDRNAFPDLSSE